MVHSISHYRQKLRERGLAGIIAGRLRWYKQAFEMDNWFIGKLVELFGNTITIQGVSLSVDNPLITPRYKSSLYFGYYEIPERELACRYLDRSLPTIEIGGSIGGVACVTNRLLENGTRHVVVECSPLLLPTLRKNRDRNECHFTIEASAIAYGSETVLFSVNDFMWGRLDPSGRRQVTVPATTIRKLLEKYEFEVINLISDCEGTEVDFVSNEREILRDRVKWLILETHEVERGKDAVAKMLADLASLGFEMREQDAKKTVYAFENKNLIGNA